MYAYRKLQSDGGLNGTFWEDRRGSLGPFEFFDDGVQNFLKFLSPLRHPARFALMPLLQS